MLFPQKDHEVWKSLSNLLQEEPHSSFTDFTAKLYVQEPQNIILQGQILIHYINFRFRHRHHYCQTKLEAIQKS